MKTPKPTAAKRRLEDEVERRKAEDEHTRLSREPEPPAPKGVPAIVAQICAKFGRPLPLPGMFEAQDAEDKAQAVRDQQAREAEYRRRAFERICPQRFREAFDWKKVAPEINTAKAREMAGRVMAWKPGADGRGLYIVGATGHSKSRLLYRLLERLIVQDRRQGIVALDGAAFSNQMTRAFGSPEETEAMLRPLCAAPILAIDDFGKRWTPATEEGAFVVMDRRTAANRPTILTLNYTADDFHDMQQARGAMSKVRDVVTPLMRRLQDYCDVIPL